MFNSLTDQQSLTNIELDMLMVMKAWRLHCLWLSSSLSLLSWISTWSLLGLWIRSKEAEAWRCPNLPDVVLWIFFRNSLSNSLRNINKLLVQLRNYPSTTKSYFYTFATFSTFRKNMTNYHKVKKSEYFLKNLKCPSEISLYFHVINTFIEMCFNRPISCSKKVL